MSEVAVDGVHLVFHQLRHRGPPRRPAVRASAGATRRARVPRATPCEKALRLDHYQNDPHRLQTPLRRRPDGTFEAIDWDTAIAEIADRFRTVIDEHGGDKILFYGGGGQGNHLGGGYGSATRARTRHPLHVERASPRRRPAEFWVDGQLFGRSRCHTTGDYHHAEVSVFWGKNPWQSHGFPQARRVLKEIAADPGRKLIVVDPRRTESADLADLHLRPRPGGDAHLLGALLACLVADGHLATRWLTDHTAGLDELLPHLERIDIPTYCERAGVPEADVREAARLIGSANGGVSIFEDLGIQQAPHSTLNSYLEKLVVLLTGNFGVPGGMNLHTRFASLGGGGGGGVGGGPATPVTGHRLVTGLVPCNIVPDEILTDHPDRFRALLVESGNPVHSIADSARMREALRALDLVVVIDIALTETAREADYVLPASSQFEKWECTFFNLEFPRNDFQLRRPVLEPLEGTLPEYEIHARLCRALGAYTDADLEPLRAPAAESRAAFTTAFLTLGMERPELARLAPVLLYETLGPTLRTPDGGDAAVGGRGVGPRPAMRPRVSRFDPPGRDRHRRRTARRRPLRRRARLALRAHVHGRRLRRDDAAHRTPRRADPARHPTAPGRVRDARRRGCRRWTVPTSRSCSPPANGDHRPPTRSTATRRGARRTRSEPSGSRRTTPTGSGSATVAEHASRRSEASPLAVVEVTDTMRDGHISLPNGFGLGPAGSSDAVGVAPNELTATEDRDWFAGTPHHKHVRARIEPVPG